MHIRAIKIQNFRGIRSANITFGKGVMCLLGPGDATKTSLLDAVEWTVGGRWSLPVSDSDFHNGNVDESIKIAVTVGGLEPKLLSLDSFGSCLRGISKSGELHAEPRPGDEEVVTVLLTVDDSLEPEWCLYRPGMESQRISARTRQKLGVYRCSRDADRDTYWSRGSLLARFTQSDSSSASRVLASAARAARKDFSEDGLGEMKLAAQRLQVLASSHCVSLREPLGPQLDPLHLASMKGALCLHEGDTPFRTRGHGARRALGLGLFSSLVTDGGVGLIDEFEAGLAPYRMRALLRRLREAAEPSDGQLILTSYSPEVIGNLRQSEVRMVSSAGGVTTVSKIPDESWKMMQKKPDTLLARKVIVCEGDTEKGLLEEWDVVAPGGLSLAMHGACAVVGGGSTTGTLALRLAEAGLPVAVLADSDRALDKHHKLIEAGVHICLWDGQSCTEQRVCRDLPWEAVRELPILASKIVGDTRPVLDALKAKIGVLQSLNDLAKLPESDPHREAIAGVATSHQWFKSIVGGSRLGRVIAENWPSGSVEGDLFKKLADLAAWIRA